MLNRKLLQCDLCVVGGGLAGMCAAISAAREGLKVVLMHERPVLGGNASSEIRMWICGSSGKNNRETGIVEEIYLENLFRNPTKSYPIWDTVLYDFIRREENITLLLNCTCMDACVSHDSYPHSRSIKIDSISGYQMTTQCFYDVKAKFFCDSSGDSILAPLTGADFKIGREGKDEFNEDTHVENNDKMTMGMSCLLLGRETNQKIKYTPPSWSTKLERKDFENRNPNIYSSYENFWYLELGGNRNTIDDTELLRDELIALATGTWDYIKNSGEHNADNWELDFLGFLPGKRESRRMCGEYMITQRDISDSVVFDDEIAYGGWPLDDHYPGGFYHKGVPNTNIKTPAPYSLPYRALYSKNVDNLFFAGRNISMTHMAMSSIRVMATCSLLGQAVGKAAFLACENNCSPHDIYLSHITLLQQLLQNEDCFLPSKTRHISDLCKNASLNVDAQNLRDGIDRVHDIYSNENSNYIYKAVPSSPITYSFEKHRVTGIHIVFDSDLNRETLPGDVCENNHAMGANIRLNSPQMHMPKTLCKSFKLVCENNGVCTEILNVTNNTKRCYHVKPNAECTKISLIPLSSWSETNDYINIISFDFN